MNCLRLSEDIEVARSGHVDALTADRWTISPDAIFREEESRIQNAISGAEQEFFRLLPGKTVLPIFTGKLGIRPDEYVRLIVEGLRANSESSLHSLGAKLEVALTSILPPRHTNQAPT